MKRITLLTLLVAIFGVTAFAQQNLRLFQQENAQSPSPAFKCALRSAQSAAQAPRRAEGELVTPPATAQVETWYTIDGKFLANSPYGIQDFTSLMTSINVAIDGSDIYIQGLSYYFKEGWIKGSVNETTATFANGQMVGQDEYGPIYFCGSNDG